jgi:hypothetical protein
VLTLNQHASQGLPWKSPCYPFFAVVKLKLGVREANILDTDRSHLQRHKERSRCNHLQEGQAQIHREASQPPCRTHLPVPIERGVCPPSQAKRRVEEEVEGGWHTRSPEETTLDAERGADNFFEGQRTRDCGSYRLRDHHLSLSVCGICLGFFGVGMDDHEFWHRTLALHDT